MPGSIGLGGMARRIRLRGYKQFGKLWRPEMCSIAGVISDGGTEDPIVGAEINLISEYFTTHRTVTGAEGVYKLQFVPVGLCFIEIAADGYVTLVDTLTVNDDIVDANFELVAAFTISGVVTDDDDNPVKDAVVSLVTDDDDEYSGITDEDGAFEILGVPAGDYTIIVIVDSEEKYTDTLTVTGDDDKVDIKLPEDENENGNGGGEDI